ncbi:hypothetical protein Q7P37_004102 [Cladosporium fusiforme]
MGPKKTKRAEPDDGFDDNAGEGSSKAAPKESARERQARLLREKTDKFVDPARERDKNLKDSGDMPKKVPSAEWVEKLAVHLASEGAFIEYMKNPGDLGDLIVPQIWLSTVYLPGRFHFYTDLEKWGNAWWSHSKSGHRPEVLQRAADIASSSMTAGQSSIRGTQAPLPSNDVKSADLREQLFKVQTTRSKLVELVKSMTDTQHVLARSLVTVITKEMDSSTSAERTELVKELAHLDRVKASTRHLLNSSALNAMGVKILDNFLQLVPSDESFGTLYQLEDDDQFPIFTQPEDQTVETQNELSDVDNVDPDVVAAKIQEDFAIPIDFLADKKLNDSKNPRDVCQVRASGKRFEGVQVSKPLQGDSMVDGKALSLLDIKCAKWLETMASSVDTDRFCLNFRDFEALLQRPDDCQNASRGDAYWIRKHAHLDIARDNIVHVRRLLCHLQENDMIKDLDALQLTMRRMYALLALMHGCVSEGAILLTIMDHLLECIAETIVGNVDPKLESQAMQNAVRLIHEQTSERKSKLAINDLKRLEKEHKAREVFAEAVRFYRGAVMLLFSAASGGKSDQAEKQTTAWYEGILNLSSRCGHSRCIDQLEIKKSKKMSDGTERWALSVAVKDARIGFPEERSIVSANRQFAYPCLYDIIMLRRYHVAYAPFFHYFAHLWHPTCRPYRGKASLADDISFVGGTEEAMEDIVDEDDEMLLNW